MSIYTTLIDVSELEAELSNPQWRIIDARYTLVDSNKGRMDYQDAHIPGALYAHMDEDLSGEIIPGVTGRHPLPPVDTFSDLLSSWGIDEDIQVVVYDYGNGAIASRLWWMLRWLGHNNVAVLKGGWPAWQQAGLAQSSTTELPERRNFQATPQMLWTVAADQVELLRGNPEICLIDSRASERYAGIKEPIDPVAGHIPGAVNLPYAENLDEQGSWRSKAELRQRFEEQMGTIPPEQTIVYCGSGVTACHNLLAMEYAGLSGAMLYPGSWSDWITDPGRGVEKN